MTKRKHRIGKEVVAGPLAGHYRMGKRFKPPLLSFETETVATDWVRDDLPDLLWPLVVARLEGDSAARLIGEVQQAVIDAVPEEILHESGAVLDGRLTSADRIPADWRDRIIESVRARGLARRAFPAMLAAVLGLYEEAPARWLMVEPWSYGTPRPTADEAADFLARAVIEAIKDPQLDALVKTPTFGWLVLRGKMTMDPAMVAVLRDYPTDPNTRPVAEAILRSGFLSLKGAAAAKDAELADHQKRWAETFWQQNWASSPCLIGEHIVPSDADVEVPGLAEAEKGVSKSLRKARAMYERYVAAVMSPELGVNLHRPARHEVACGLVVRAYRAVAAILATPQRWSGENALDVVRLLVELNWNLRWMAAQDTESGFERFQAYGAGKRKLMRRHMEELEAMFGEDAPDFLRAATEHFRRATGGDWAEEFQE